MDVAFAPSFIREYKKLPKDLQAEIKDKITVFQSDPHHPFLKTHKLKGKLAGRYSFSVNYKYRIVFVYLSPKEAVFLTVGDHEVYS